MKREIVLATVTFVVAASGGFLLGRQFPAHHYEPWKNSSLLLDTATGRVCSPFVKQTDPYADGGHIDSNPVDKALKGDAWDQAMAERNKTNQNNIPSCN